MGQTWRNCVHHFAKDNAVLQNILVRVSIENLLAKDGLNPSLNFSLLTEVTLAFHLKIHCTFYHFKQDLTLVLEKSHIGDFVIFELGA